ncbi:MAG TPA: GNAT family N-acetyltransferase, partial [Gemmatimonadales bacterium]|nr:GNAT family N-acetyltransferase [Gemmatimonadales bacterium]
YGSEAAIATLEYARSRLGLPRLAAIVNPENQASIRILEKAGMTYRGPILMPGETVPISHYTT